MSDDNKNLLIGLAIFAVGILPVLACTVWIMAWFRHWVMNSWPWPPM